MVQQALETTTRGVNVAHAEAALRSWAAQDSNVAARFLAVEQAQVDFLAATLTALGYDRTSALRLSKALYLALVGLYAARSYAPHLADEASLLDLVDRLIVGVPSRADSRVEGRIGASTATAITDAPLANPLAPRSARRQGNDDCAEQQIYQLVPKLRQQTVQAGVGTTAHSSFAAVLGQASSRLKSAQPILDIAAEGTCQGFKRR